MFNDSNLSPLFAAGGNSRAARSARAKLQWRDRFGRWIEMGRGVKFKVRFPDGNVKSITGTYFGAVDSDTGQVYVTKDPSGLPDGFYEVDSANAQEILTSLAPEALAKAGIEIGKHENGNPVGQRLDEDIPNLANIPRNDAPIGWKVSDKTSANAKVWDTEDDEFRLYIGKRVVKGKLQDSWGVEDLRGGSGRITAYGNARNALEQIEKLDGMRTQREELDAVQADEIDKQSAEIAPDADLKAKLKPYDPDGAIGKLIDSGAKSDAVLSALRQNSAWQNMENDLDHPADVRNAQQKARDAKGEALRKEIANLDRGSTTDVEVPAGTGGDLELRNVAPSGFIIPTGKETSDTSPEGITALIEENREFIAEKAGRRLVIDSDKGTAAIYNSADTLNNAKAQAGGSGAAEFIDLATGESIANDKNVGHEDGNTNPTGSENPEETPNETSDSDSSEPAGDDSGAGDPVGADAPERPADSGEDTGDGDEDPANRRVAGTPANKPDTDRNSRDELAKRLDKLIEKFGDTENSAALARIEKQIAEIEDQLAKLDSGDDSEPKRAESAPEAPEASPEPEPDAPAAEEAPDEDSLEKKVDGLVALTDNLTKEITNLEKLARKDADTPEDHDRIAKLNEEVKRERAEVQDRLNTWKTEEDGSRTRQDGKIGTNPAIKVTPPTGDEDDIFARLEAEMADEKSLMQELQAVLDDVDPAKQAINKILDGNAADLDMDDHQALRDVGLGSIARIMEGNQPTPEHSPWFGLSSDEIASGAPRDDDGSVDFRADEAQAAVWEKRLSGQPLDADEQRLDDEATERERAYRNALKDEKQASLEFQGTPISEHIAQANDFDSPAAKWDALSDLELQIETTSPAQQDQMLEAVRKAKDAVDFGDTAPEAEAEPDEPAEPAELKPWDEGGKPGAEAYEAMEHDPDNPEVQASYNALVNAVIQQYKDMKAEGLTIEMSQDDPYENSAAMLEDVENNKHLKAFADGGATLPDDHPMKAMVDIDGETLNINDVFRAVHDYFGHVKSKDRGAVVSFGPRGEWEAWRTHRLTLPQESWMALWDETRGQNTWTNYFGDNNSLPIADRPFAEQKAGIVGEDIFAADLTGEEPEPTPEINVPQWRLNQIGPDRWNREINRIRTEEGREPTTDDFVAFDQRMQRQENALPAWAARSREEFPGLTEDSPLGLDIDGEFHNSSAVHELGEPESSDPDVPATDVLPDDNQADSIDGDEDTQAFRSALNTQPTGSQAQTEYDLGWEDSDADYANEKFMPTQEQRQIVRGVLGGKNVAVQALAGTGKTSTLELTAKRIQEEFPDKKVLYIAFNKSVQTEAEGRMPSNVESRTGDSLGYVGVPRNISSKLGNRDLLIRADDIAAHLKLRPQALGDNRALDSDDVARELANVINKFSISEDDKINSTHFDDLELPFNARTLDAANAYWADLISPTGKIKVNNSHLTKLWALGKPDLSQTGSGVRKPADIIFFDEAQDINPVMARVVREQSVQKVYVGDGRQAIYGFRGAENELDKVEVDVVLPLTQSWRFGPQVAGMGNRFLSLLNSDLKVVGGGPDSEILEANTMQDADAILTRSNAGAVMAIIEELDNERVVGVAKKTKDDLQALVKTAWWLKKGGYKPRMHEDLAGYNSWAEIEKDVETEKASTKTNMLFNLVNNIGLDVIQRAVNDLRVTDEEDSGPLGGDIEIKPGTKGNLDKGAKFEISGSGDAMRIDVFNSFKIKDDLKAKGYRFDGNKKSWYFQGNAAQIGSTLGLEGSEQPDALPPIDVVVTTAHKAKGLEWERVRIGDDFRGPREKELPNGDVVMEYPSKEEIRLAYVAVTRAKKALDPGSLDWVRQYTEDSDEDPNTPSRGIDWWGDALQTAVPTPEPEVAPEPEAVSPQEAPEAPPAPEPTPEPESAPEPAPEAAPEPSVGDDLPGDPDALKRMAADLERRAAQRTGNSQRIVRAELERIYDKIDELEADTVPEPRRNNATIAQPRLGIARVLAETKDIPTERYEEILDMIHSGEISAPELDDIQTELRNAPDKPNAETIRRPVEETEDLTEADETLIAAEENPETIIDPDLIMQDVKRNHPDFRTMPNQDVILESIDHRGRKYDLVVRRTKSNRFFAYVMETDPKTGARRASRLQNETHSYKALRSKISKGKRVLRDTRSLDWWMDRRKNREVLGPDGSIADSAMDNYINGTDIPMTTDEVFNTLVSSIVEGITQNGTSAAALKAVAKDKKAPKKLVDQVVEAVTRRKMIDDGQALAPDLANQPAHLSYDGDELVSGMWVDWTDTDRTIPQKDEAGNTLYEQNPDGSFVLRPNGTKIPLNEPNPDYGRVFRGQIQHLRYKAINGEGYAYGDNTLTVFPERNREKGRKPSWQGLFVSSGLKIVDGKSAPESAPFFPKEREAERQDHVASEFGVPETGTARVTRLAPAAPRAVEPTIDPETGVVRVEGSLVSIPLDRVHAAEKALAASPVSAAPVDLQPGDIIDRLSPTGEADFETVIAVEGQDGGTTKVTVARPESNGTISVIEREFGPTLLRVHRNSAPEDQTTLERQRETLTHLARIRRLNAAEQSDIDDLLEDVSANSGDFEAAIAEVDSKRSEPKNNQTSTAAALDVLDAVTPDKERVDQVRQRVAQDEAELSTGDAEYEVRPIAFEDVKWTAARDPFDSLPLTPGQDVQVGDIISKGMGRYRYHLQVLEIRGAASKASKGAVVRVIGREGERYGEGWETHANGDIHNLPLWNDKLFNVKRPNGNINRDYFVDESKTPVLDTAAMEFARRRNARRFDNTDLPDDPGVLQEINESGAKLADEFKRGFESTGFNTEGMRNQRAESGVGADGTLLFVKKGKNDELDPDGVRRTHDNELLGNAVARAVGIENITMGSLGDEVVMNLVEGEDGVSRWDEFQQSMTDIWYWPNAWKTGIVDFIIGNVDRHAANVIIDIDGEMVPIDWTNSGWEEFAAMNSPYTIQLFEDIRTGKHKLTSAELLRILGRLQSLYPMFAKLGRKRSYQSMIQNFNDIIRMVNR